MDVLEVLFTCSWQQLAFPSLWAEWWIYVAWTVFSDHILSCHNYMLAFLCSDLSHHRAADAVCGSCWIFWRFLYLQTVEIQIWRFRQDLDSDRRLCPSNLPGVCCCCMLEDNPTELNLDFLEGTQKVYGPVSEEAADITEKGTFRGDEKTRLTFRGTGVFFTKLQSVCKNVSIRINPCCITGTSSSNNNNNI